MSRRLRYWLLLIIGALGAAWILWTLGLAVGETAANDGLGGLPASPVIQHKIGELMIVGPLWLAALMQTTKPVSGFLLRTWPVALIGAGLNALAWWNALGPWTDLNRLWFAGLVVIGVVAPPALARLLRR